MRLLGLKPHLKLSQKRTAFRFETLLFLLIGSFLFSGCGEFLKGKPQAPDYLEINSGSLACLGDVSADLQKFLNSTASSDELDKTVSCIDGTLTEFQSKVQGRAEADSFTADEVYDIFSTFAKEAKLSRDAAKNLIVLKAALLGGSKDKVTKAELGFLKDYLQVVKAEAKKLIPYIKLYFMKDSDRAYTKPFIQQAFAQLNASLKSLLQASKIAQGGYSFEDFKNLVINLMQLSATDKSRIEILAQVNYVLNGAQLELNDSERLQYIDNITEFLRLYAVQVNGYASFKIETPLQMDETLDFLQQVLTLLENSLQYKKTNIISVSTIDGLVTEITQSDILPYKITAASAIDFYRTLFTRVFESGYFGNVAGFYGLKAINFIHLKRELAVYRVYSKLISKVGTSDAFQSGTTSYPLPDVQSAMAALNIEDEQDVLSGFDRNNQLQIISIVQEMRSEFLEATPVIYKNSKMGVAANQSTWSQSWKDLQQGLFAKMLTRFIMLGWGESYLVMNTNSTQISQLGMVKWYNEFKPIGIEIKMLDPRIDNAGASSLKAGNLFTISGNGDEKLTYKEALQYVGVLISGGNVAATQIRNDMEAYHCNLPELDVFDNHWNNEACMYQTLRANYRIYFSSLPYLVAFLDTMAEPQFKAFFQNVMSVVRHDPANAGIRVESTEVAGLSSLVYFVESLFAAHDLNSNWTISESEIRTAYPKFQAVAAQYAHSTSQKQLDDFSSWEGDLAGYSCFSQDDLIRESFIFLLYNGHTPSVSDFNILPCPRGKPLMNFSGEVDRSKIINTLKALESIL